MWRIDLSPIVVAYLLASATLIIRIMYISYPNASGLNFDRQCGINYSLTKTGCGGPVVMHASEFLNEKEDVNKNAGRDAVEGYYHGWILQFIHLARPLIAIFFVISPADANFSAETYGDLHGQRSRRQVLYRPTTSSIILNHPSGSPLSISMWINPTSDRTAGVF